MVVAEEVITFVNLIEHLWSHQKGTHASANSPRELHGKVSWPFSLTLPSTVEVKHKSYSLPASFAMKHARTVIQYRVFATVVHGMFSAEHV